MAEEQDSFCRRNILKAGAAGAAGLVAFPGLANANGSDDPFVENPGEGVTLFAGQDIDVGTVSVALDGDELSITYDTTETSAGDDSDWVITDTHLHVGADAGDIPTNRSGNPKVGHFEYSGKPDGSTQTVTYDGIDVSDLEESIAVAAKAEVAKKGTEEGAWADGERIVEAEETGSPGPSGSPGRGGGPGRGGPGRGGPGRGGRGNNEHKRGNWATYFEFDPDSLRDPIVI